MDRCATCQARLLEHLYGLLDGDDRPAFEAHLAACPACQAALDTARRQQALLARAARAEFPGGRFAPPADAPAPAVLTLPPRPAPAPAPARRRARRWAAAAAVLLAAGLGVPGAYYG